MKKEYNHKEIVCGCGVLFLWSKGEQKFMDTLLANGCIKVLKEPTRCPICRMEKKIKYKK